MNDAALSHGFPTVVDRTLGYRTSLALLPPRYSGGGLGRGPSGFLMITSCPLPNPPPEYRGRGLKEVAESSNPGAGLTSANEPRLLCGEPSPAVPLPGPLRQLYRRLIPF